MNEVVILALSVVAGLLLGAFVFGGLWWTVGKGLASQRPGLWFFLSLLLRMSVALTVFYFVGREHWQRLVVCLLGFVIARLVIQRLTQPLADDQARQPQEAGHAP